MGPLGVSHVPCPRTLAEVTYSVLCSGRGGELTVLTCTGSESAYGGVGWSYKYDAVGGGICVVGPDGMTYDGTAAPGTDDGYWDAWSPVGKCPDYWSSAPVDDDGCPDGTRSASD